MRVSFGVESGWWRKLAVAAALLAASVMTGGCLADNVTRDLGLYVNRDVNSIAGLEQGCLERYRCVSGQNYKNDDTLYRVLKGEILPVYSSFCGLAFRIEPQTEAVRRLHSYYLEAAHYRLQGFRTVVLAIESGDPDLIRVANENFTKASRAAAKWRSRVDGMAELHGITFGTN